MTHTPWQSCLAKPDTRWLPTLSRSEWNSFLAYKFPVFYWCNFHNFSLSLWKKRPSTSVLFPPVTKGKSPTVPSFIKPIPIPIGGQNFSFMRSCTHGRGESALKRKTNMHKSSLQSIVSKCSNSRTTLVNGISAPIPLEGFRNVFCLWAAN